VAGVCQVNAVCGDGIVQPPEVCDGTGCLPNCSGCDSNHELSGNSCVLKAPTDIADTSEQDQSSDLIEDLTDLADIIEDQTDTSLDQTDQADQTPDQIEDQTPETQDQTDTPETTEPKLEIDPNCDASRIEVETVYNSLNISCPEGRYELDGAGELSIELHEGISPVKIILGDEDANKGRIDILMPEIEGVLPAKLVHQFGFYDLDKESNSNLSNGNAQIEASYEVDGAIMALTPIGTRYTMDKIKLSQRNFSHLGEIKEGNVLVNIFDKETGALKYSRNFTIGEQIFFTTENLSTVCAPGSACPFLPIQPEDLSEGTLEESDFVNPEVEPTAKDPGGCGCMVLNTNGEIEIIPLSMGLMALGLVAVLRRRKED
jgi:hypothetical protein